MTHTPPPHVRSWKCGRWLCLSDFHLLNHERHSGRALTFMIHTLEGFFWEYSTSMSTEFYQVNTRLCEEYRTFTWTTACTM